MEILNRLQKTIKALKRIKRYFIFLHFLMFELAIFNQTFIFHIKLILECWFFKMPFAKFVTWN